MTLQYFLSLITLLYTVYGMLLTVYEPHNFATKHDFFKYTCIVILF